MSRPDVPSPAPTATNRLRALDYSVLQQCMHCGMCLPTCPTYDATKLERHSPRGRIALMRAVADGELDVTRTFADEMYFCLGCLACETACPAGVNYTELFETARAATEESGVLASPRRTLIRTLLLRGLFTRPRLLRAVGRALWIFQASGLESLARRWRLTALLPGRLRTLEPQAPRIQARFSHQLIRPIERPTKTHHRVALLTGCVQDLTLPSVNRDTVDVLLANGCEVHTPPVQPCCGSLLAHNGDLETAKSLARRLIDLLPPTEFDAILTNAAGCGSHLKRYGHLLADDPRYAERAREWDARLRDIHEWLDTIGLRPPTAGCGVTQATYHEACHLCHGQKITRQPRAILDAIPGLRRRELPESSWCCGSAGIYNITQPEMAARLQQRKVSHIMETGVSVVATANPGCHLQLENGLRARGAAVAVEHPISLLARAYRNEPREP